MRHGKKIRKLSRIAGHRRAMLRNLATSIFQYQTIKTTVPRAKEVRKVVERLIKYSIGGTLADKRRIISYLTNRSVAHELIKMGKENFANRAKGGYTAIYHIAKPRAGDGSEMVLLKILKEAREKKRKRKTSEPDVIQAVEVTTKPETKKTRKKAKEPIAEEAASPEQEVTEEKTEQATDIQENQTAEKPKEK